MKYVLFVAPTTPDARRWRRRFFERHAPDDVRAESAGSAPAAEVWLAVIETMNEVGIDLRGRRPRKLMVEMQLHADWAVTMGCGDVCPYVPTTVEDSDLRDPAGKSFEEVREIRDEIEERVRCPGQELRDDARAPGREHGSACSVRRATWSPSDAGVRRLHPPARRAGSSVRRGGRWAGADRVGVPMTRARRCV